MSLTAGAISRIFDDGVLTDKPYVQVVDIKKVSSGEQRERYRVVISDGVTYQQAMLASQLNALVDNKTLENFCVVQLLEAMCHDVSNRKMFILLNISLVNKDHTAIIGNPQNGAKGGQNQFQQQQPQYQQQQQPQSNYNYGTGNQGGNNSYKAGSNYNSSAHQSFTPIAALNPYQPVWTIKARVTSKSDMRTWDNARSKGHLFSVDLLDAQGGQIKCTMFNAEADKFFNVFNADSVYIISKGQLKLANKKFSRLPSEYEITLGKDSEVTFCQDDGAIQKQQFEFTRIDELKDVEPAEFVDVCGVVKSVAPIQSFVSSKTQREFTKRTLTIVDEGLMGVELTVWGDNAEKYNETELGNNPVIACKSVKVSDYGGRSLSMNFSSQIFINPDIPAAHNLRSWYDAKGHEAQIQSLSVARTGGSSVRKVLSDVVEENLGQEKPDFFDVRATITHIPQNMEKPIWYNACQKADCNKKVTENDQGYFCEKCNDTYSSFEPRYIARMLVSDPTGTQWLSAFNEAAQAVLGQPASQLLEYKEQANNVAWSDVFSKANFQTYIFTIKAATQRVEDENRTQLTLLRVKPINYVQESQLLLEEIQSYG